MASEIIVQTLKGPTSGANANKVIIPSGQTLDASAGGFTPAAGQIVQCVQQYNSANSKVATTSQSYVASGIKKSITPQYSDSLIIIQSSISMGDVQTGHYGKASMYVNGSAMPGSANYHHGYMEAGKAEYAPFIFQGQYQVTSLATLEFEVYFTSISGGEFRISHNDSSSGVTLWEIKQ
jgi:hypothetical protein